MNRTNRILGNGKPSKNGSPSFVPICVQCTVCSDTNARKFQGKCAAHPRIKCFNEKPILKSEFSSMWRAVKTELIHSMFYNVPLIECKSQDKILFIAKNRVKSWKPLRKQRFSHVGILWCEEIHSTRNLQDIWQWFLDLCKLDKGISDIWMKLTSQEKFLSKEDHVH